MLHPRPHKLPPADRLEGAAVYGLSGERIGHLAEIAFDKISGRAAYALVSQGGFMGLGERYHPLPWSVLHYDPRKSGYVVPIDRRSFEEGPSFDPKAQDKGNDADYRDDVHSYYADYGARPYWDDGLESADEP